MRRRKIQVTKVDRKDGEQSFLDRSEGKRRESSISKGATALVGRIRVTSFV